MALYESVNWSPPRRLDASASVFHYTSPGGLLGMLETGTIRATEASGLNDVAEIVQGQRFVREKIDALPSGELRDDLLFALEQVMDANGPAASDVFVLAASLQNDDANQWRLYGDGGRGYCVELDSSAPLTVLTEHAPSSTPVAGGASGSKLDFGFIQDVGYVSAWSRVLYDDAARQEAFDDLVMWADTARSLADAAEWPDPESGDPTPHQEYAYDLSRAVASLTRCIKASGFAGEDEARVLVSFLVGDKHAHFRAAEYGIVRHFELAKAIGGNPKAVHFGVRSSSEALPIRSVRLGPSLKPDLCTPAVRSLLVRHGYADSTTIELSGIPLR
ncbi:DUF2971 domain-containing protein [Pedococcus soli]